MFNINSYSKNKWLFKYKLAQLLLTTCEYNYQNVSKYKITLNQQKKTLVEYKK